MRRFIVLLVFLCSTSLYASSTNYAPLDSVGSIVINGKTCVRYLVSPGETIYRISTMYRVSISDLMEMNPELEGGLKVGQMISIPYNKEALAAGRKELMPPTASAAPASSSAQVVQISGNKKVHKVQAGETLYSLSKKYNIPLNDLIKWNNMELKAGQEIVVGVDNANNETALEAPKEKPVTQTNTSSVTPSPEKTPPTPVVATAAVEEKKPEPKEPVKIIPSAKFTDTTRTYDFDPSMEQVLIIPFDPYLYFSDADDEIAAASNMQRTKVRQIFRRRMNALLDHPAYENIHLLGGKAADSISDLNKIYSSVTYNYQEALYNPNYKDPKAVVVPQQTTQQGKGDKSWLQKQKDKLSPSEETQKYSVSKDNGKYFGVIIKNPEFFNYFNKKYNVDYYIFINQFEVKTNYEHCLDRAVQNFDRSFTTHFSIFDSTGKQIAGSKFKLNYNSNSNQILQIVGENMQKITDRILAELPTPAK